MHSYSKKISPSVVIYLLLLVVTLVLRLLLRLLSAGQIASLMVNLTDSLSVGAIWMLGWVGVYLAARTGFAEMWQADIPHLKRFVFPALIGAGIGILTIVFDLIQPLGDES